MRKKLVAGNWKMNGDLATNAALLSALVKSPCDHAKVELAVCVPYPYLSQAAEALRDSAIELGAQDVSEYEHGAYTGEVSSSMLRDFGCRYVLVGHSERRSYFGDTDAVVAAKFSRAIKSGLTPILCVGESLEERETGVTAEVVTRQMDVVLDLVAVDLWVGAVIAYEPVWAIGTGRTASPDQAQEVHSLIRARLAKADAGVASRLRILYGGSMKPSNAGELLKKPDIDGGLIGGASLVADDFLAIAAAV